MMVMPLKENNVNGDMIGGSLAVLYKHKMIMLL